MFVIYSCYVGFIKDSKMGIKTLDNKILSEIKTYPSSYLFYSLQGIMQTYGKENISTPSSSDRNEPLVTSPTPNKTVPVRPLTAAYQAARSDHQVNKRFDLMICDL